MPRKTDLQKHVDTFVASLRDDERRRQQRIVATRKTLSHKQALEKEACEHELRRLGAGKKQREATLAVLCWVHRRQHRQITVDLRAAQRAEVQAFEREQQALQTGAAWRPAWPNVALATNDRRSIQWWDHLFASNPEHTLPEHTFLDWLSLSHRPRLKRPPLAELPAGLPDFWDLMALQSVQDRISDIAASRDHQRLERLRYALVPAAPGRPKKTIDESEMATVLTFRDELKRQLQQAKRDGLNEHAYCASVRAILAASSPDCPPDLVTDLMAKTMMKPSDLAARVTAYTFKLPISRIRSGKAGVLPSTRQRRQPLVLGSAAYRKLTE